MKYNIPLSAIIVLLLGLGCGGAKEEGLEAKKEKLSKLRTELQKLSKEVKALETEIGLLDTSRIEEPSEVPVKIASVENTDFKHFVKVQGQVEADNLIMVSPKAPGMVTQVLVKNGDNVRSGQLIAQLDAAVVKSSIAEMQHQLVLATTVYEKQKNLWDRKIGSEIQFLQAKNNMESLQNSIATVQTQLANFSIYAPISGTVENVMMKTGQAAAPGIPVCMIVNMSELVFKAEISEAYLPSIKRGDQVSVYFPTLNETIQAKISNISQTIHPINRTVKVEVDLPRNYTSAKANMTGEISINDITRVNATTIPLSYIQKSGKGEYVYTAQKRNDGQWIAKIAPISSGMTYEGQVEITTGLKAGDKLIVEGFQRLSDGQKIKFQDSGSN